MKCRHVPASSLESQDQDSSAEILRVISRPARRWDLDNPRLQSRRLEDSELLQFSTTENRERSVRRIDCEVVVSVANLHELVEPTTNTAFIYMQSTRKTLVNLKVFEKELSSIPRPHADHAAMSRVRTKSTCRV